MGWHLWPATHMLALMTNIQQLGTYLCDQHVTCPPSVCVLARIDDLTRIMFLKTQSFRQQVIIFNLLQNSEVNHRCEQVKKGTMRTCSCERLKWPVSSVIKSDTWIAFPWPFFLNGILPSLTQTLCRSSLEQKMLSSWCTGICFFSPGLRMGWMGSRVSLSKVVRWHSPLLITAKNSVQYFWTSGHSWPSTYTPFCAVFNSYLSFFNQCCAQFSDIFVVPASSPNAGIIVSLTSFWSFWGEICRESVSYCNDTQLNRLTSPGAKMVRNCRTAWWTLSLFNNEGCDWCFPALEGGRVWNLCM